MFCKNCGTQLNQKETPQQIQTVFNDYNNNNYYKYGDQQYHPGKSVTKAKSKIAAGLSEIFLGAFGVHNFYLGFMYKAIAKLLITVLLCCIFSQVSEI